LSDPPARQNLAAEAQTHYAESVALLEPLAARTRSLLQYLAPLFEHWAAVDVIVQDTTAAREHKTKARDCYQQLNSQADVQRLDLELSPAESVP
jgi:hypothetical protein